MTHLHRENSRFIVGKHYRPVLSVAISNDECFLASGSIDHTVQVWNLRDRKAPAFANL